MKNHPEFWPYVEALMESISRLDSKESALKLLAAEHRGLKPDEIAFFSELRRQFVPRSQVDSLVRAACAVLAHLDQCPRREAGAGGMTIDAQISRTKINSVNAGEVEHLRGALELYLAQQPEHQHQP